MTAYEREREGLQNADMVRMDPWGKCVSRWYVLYRDPASSLCEHWKVQGEAPTRSYPTYEAARNAALSLARGHFYDVQVVGCPFRMFQGTELKD